VLDCEQSYYTETRAIMINRGSTYRPEFASIDINKPTPEGTVINDVTKGKYTTVLVPSPSRTTMTSSEFDQMVMLREKLGVKIPDEMLIELSSAPNKAQLIKNLKGDTNKQEAAQAAQAQHIQDLEGALLQAKAAKEQGAAKLNDARATKALSESQVNPHVLHAQTESTRVATDAQLARERMGLDQQKIGLQRRGQDHSTALALTKIDAENARHGHSLLADAAATAQTAAVDAANTKKTTDAGATP
jgi:hypothetical protein